MLQTVYEQYYTKLHLVPLAMVAGIQQAEKFVHQLCHGAEPKYNEETQNWEGTSYYYDEQHLWKKVK